MTEQTQQQPQEQAAQPQQQVAMPPLTPQQLETVKQSLLANLNGNYRQFIMQILQIPSDENARKNALMYLDTGYFWFECAIKNFAPQNQTVLPPLPQAPVEPPQQQQSESAPEEATSQAPSEASAPVDASADAA